VKIIDIMHFTGKVYRYPKDARTLLNIVQFTLKRGIWDI